MSQENVEIVRRTNEPFQGIEERERYSWTQSNWSAVREHVIFDVEIRATGKGSGVELGLSE
jgi:hypothetical protein